MSGGAGHWKGRGRRIGAAAALVALAGAALGQDDGGTLITFGIRPELSYDDNLGLNPASRGGSTVLDTRLSFGFASRTRNQTLSLDLSDTLRFSDGPDGDETGSVDPRLGFLYSRESARSRLEVTASYQETDLGLLSSDTDPQLVVDPVTGELTISTGTGRRATASAALHFETGIDAPLGATLDLRHTGWDYDSTDPDLTDGRSDSLSAGLRLAFSPVLTGRLTVTASQSESDDAVDTVLESRRVTLGLDYQLDPATRVSLGFGPGEAVTDTTAGRSEERGTTASVSIERELGNGRVGLSYGREVTTAGSRDSLQLSRALELPRGRLSFVLGASQGEEGDPDLIGHVDYAQVMARGEFRLALDRSVVSDSDGNDVLSTRLSAGMTQQLTALSALHLDLGYARVEETGLGLTSTSEQSDLELSWQRQMPQDWMLSAGYRYRQTSDEAGTASSNAVFLNLGREFAIRP
jgi:hypothetical protein